MVDLVRLASIFKPEKLSSQCFIKLHQESLPLEVLMDRKAFWKSPYVERTERS